MLRPRKGKVFMFRQKTPLTILICLLTVAVIATISVVLRKHVHRVGEEDTQAASNACAYDGTRINPLYKVDAYLNDDRLLHFCSIYCATRWFEHNKDRVIYFTVTDEMTGQPFDSTLGHFVEGEPVTVREVNNRIHAFFSKEDAMEHASRFNGKFIDNPFAQTLVLPKGAQTGALVIGVPSLPDALPVRLALFRPIFKENRLDVTVVSVEGDESGKNLLMNGSVDGLICDLPTGIDLAGAGIPIQVIKNMLRANPFRPLFAMVGAPQSEIRNMSGLKTHAIAVPAGVSFRFYLEFFFKRAQVPLDQVTVREVGDASAAWDLLNRGEVSAAVLRTPYTDMAMKKGMTLFADDRNFPWMSVLVMKQSTIAEKSEVVRRFIFSLEQSVLALNLKPDEFRPLLRDQGGIPRDSRRDFPMPIFEGANAPSADEVSPIVEWLMSSGRIHKEIPYKGFVDTQFLPDPNDVGLAFCCR